MTPVIARMPASLIVEIEERVAQMREARPDRSVTRSTVIRRAIRLGFEVWDDTGDED
jgi:hypothetical protein